MFSALYCDWENRKEHARITGKVEQLENKEAETNPTTQRTQKCTGADICQFIKQKMARLNENAIFVCLLSTRSYIRLKKKTKKKKTERENKENDKP